MTTNNKHGVDAGFDILFQEIEGQVEFVTAVVAGHGGPQEDNDAQKGAKKLQALVDLKKKLAGLRSEWDSLKSM